MKILFVIRDMVVGGAGKQLALTANALSAKGHDVFVYTYFGGALQHVLNENVTYVAQNPVPRNKITEYLFSSWNIRKQIKRLCPDVVISWRCNAGCFTVLASIGLKVKTIFSERTDPYTETSLALKISSWVCGFSDGGVFQLEQVRKYYKRLYEKSIVIHNPINICSTVLKNVPYTNRPDKIVHVGRMMLPHKRQDVMVDAFKLFLERNPDFVLHFYGDGRDFEIVKKMAKEKNLVNNIEFHGAVNNVLDSIRDAKMLVLTSDYEGIPNVILEAFSVSVPVVSTDCSPGGARLLLEDNRNGLLAHVGDAFDVAKQMQRVVDDGELVQKFIQNGSSKIKDFAPDTIFEKWNCYINKIGEK